MSVIKRIISFVLVIAILICFAVPFAYAATEYKSTHINYGELVLHKAYYYGDRVFGDDSPLSGLGRFLKGTSTALLVNDVCTKSYDSYHACTDGITFDENAIGWDDYGKYYLLQCNYCDKWFRCYSSDIFDAHDEYVNSLEYLTVTDENLFTFYPTGWHYDWSNYSSPKFNSNTLTSYHGGFEINATALHSNNEGFVYVYSSSFELPKGLYVFSLDRYGGRSLEASMLYNYYEISLSGSNDGQTWEDIGTAKQESYKYNSYGYYSVPFYFSTYDYDYNFYRCYIALPSSGSLGGGSSYYAMRECSITCTELPDGSYNGGNTTPETRPVSLMQNINNYNTENNYIDNSTTNYFIGIVGDNGEVTDVYNPTVYDETTKIFTEPVTGAQYQTSGWAYNYLSRTYDIAFADNTFLIGATSVSRVELTYGDEAVTLVYYDANNNILGQDNYSYVAVAKDECTLYGHSNTCETIKEATCTEYGERKYACSRCGNEYIENIPLEEHVYKVMKEVSTSYDDDGNVTVYGYTLYSCEICGDEYIESEAPDVSKEGWLNWFGEQFRNLGTGLVGGLSKGLEYLTGTVIKSVTDWSIGLVEWLFGLVDGEVLTTWYSWFNIDNPYIQEEFDAEVENVWA